jgi:uncharacterized membrane protein
MLQGESLMNASFLVASAIAAAAAFSVTANAAPAPVPTYHFEKCYGIATRGGNDCGTATHSCAGTSTKAKDPDSWLYVPVGTCTKIVGGSLSPKS